jgi:hypothetical protein
MRLLQSSLTGSAEIEEADEMAEKLMDEILSALMDVTDRDRMRVIEKITRAAKE